MPSTPKSKKTKTLYNIPTEEEIQGAVPAKPLTAKAEPEVTPEVAETLPVKEPEPIAVVDTAKEAEVSAKAKADAAAKKAAENEAREAAMAKEKADREAKLKDGYRLAALRPEMRTRDFSEHKPKKPKGKVAVTSEEIKELKKTLDIAKFDGISVGGRNSVVKKNDRRITRDRYREARDKYETVTLKNAGETQQLSEASQFMLDMLRKNPRR